MKTNEVSVAEARRCFSELLSRVAFRGERVVIVRRGRPVARLVPVGKAGEESLASVHGWLEPDDPFLLALDQIAAERVGRVARVARKGRRP